ncbi:MAG: hypothetical protein R3F14_04330 [Polyangiaceae bacterium]
MNAAVVWSPVDADSTIAEKSSASTPTLPRRRVSNARCAHGTEAAAIPTTTSGAGASLRADTARSADVNASADRSGPEAASACAGTAGHADGSLASTARRRSSPETISGSTPTTRDPVSADAFTH